MADFTKGEWKVDKMELMVYVEEPDNEVFYLADFANTGLPDKENLANAQLFKSSPKLYEALKKIIRAGVIYPGGGFDDAFEAFAEVEGK